VARILFVGGGARARGLATELLAAGHAVRMTTREESGRSAIEAAGAECWIGTPDRIASLRYALENVTVACWLLGTARGTREELAALHGSRLAFFATQTIDTTVRGLLYEAAGCVESGLLENGRALIVAAGAYNEIPVAVLTTDPADELAWRVAARGALDGLLEGLSSAPSG